MRVTKYAINTPTTITLYNDTILLCNNPENLIPLYYGTKTIITEDPHYGHIIEYNKSIYADAKEKIIKAGFALKSDKAQLYEVEFINKDGIYNSAFNRIYKPYLVNAELLSKQTLEDLKVNNLSIIKGESTL